MEYAIVNIE